MSMTKKQIIESLKAMEIDYNATDTRDELQCQLDEAMGTSKKAIESKKDSVKTETEEPSAINVTSLPKGRQLTFDEVMAYNRAQKNKAAK